MLDAALSCRVLFVGGKGGVGKTTMAAALAVRAADRGRRCLVVSTDPAHSLGDVFGRAIGGEVMSLDNRLHGLEIDPEAEANDHITSVIAQMKRLVHPAHVPTCSSDNSILPARHRGRWRPRCSSGWPN